MSWKCDPIQWQIPMSLLLRSTSLPPPLPPPRAFRFWKVINAQTFIVYQIKLRIIKLRVTKFCSNFSVFNECVIDGTILNYYFIYLFLTCHTELKPSTHLTRVFQSSQRVMRLYLKCCRSVWKEQEFFKIFSDIETKQKTTLKLNWSTWRKTIWLVTARKVFVSVTILWFKRK